MSRVRLDGRAVDTVSFRNNTIAIMCTYKYSRRSGPQVLAKNPPVVGNKAGTETAESAVSRGIK